MKIIIIITIAALISSPQLCFSQSQESSMTRQWFDTKECIALEIKKYQSISEHQIIRSVTIEDTDVVKKIMARIKKIPTEGDMMISFGPNAESIDLLFHCDNGTKQTVEIYQNKFKTPSTGFNSDKNETETSLYADIDAILFPDIEKKILKIQNVEFKFKEFSLTYTGKTVSEKEAATVSWTRDHFWLKDKTNTEQAIEIISSQLPPPPYNFDILKSGFTLLTYQTESKERLYPDYFQVTKRNR